MKLNDLIPELQELVSQGKKGQNVLIKTTEDIGEFRGTKCPQKTLLRALVNHGGSRGQNGHLKPRQNVAVRIEVNL